MLYKTKQIEKNLFAITVYCILSVEINVVFFNFYCHKFLIHKN